MKEISSNGLSPIIAQAIEEMKAEQGKNFSLEKINLAELERRTGLSRAKLRRLKEHGFKDMPQAHNVLIMGTTGVGKTYLACALGIAANRNFYSVQYVRLPDILTEISIARGNGTYRDVMKRYKKVKLLILDEWLLYPLKEHEARDLLELIEARYKVASTIFCSQFDTPSWHENLYDPTVADAICDRIIYDAYRVKIEGESMRKRNAIID